MFGVLLSGLILLILGALIPAFANESTYGSSLEEYIVSHNPKDTYDVERLTKEYDEKNRQGFI